MAEGNSLTDLMKFFSTPEKPVSPSEMKELWAGLSEDEKNYYRDAMLQDKLK